MHYMAVKKPRRRSSLRFIQILERVHLHQFKGCKVLTMYVEGKPFVNKRYTKGVPFLPEKGKGLDLDAQPLRIKLCWVRPRCDTTIG